MAQGDLGHLQSHAHPVGGDVVDVVEVEAGNGDGPQLVIPAGRVLDGHPVVVGLIGQGDEARESAAAVLLAPQLVQVIHAVFQRLDVAVEHGAGAAASQLVPGAVDAQVLLAAFLAGGDAAADLLAEDLCAAAGEGFKTGRLQFLEGVPNTLLGQPSQVQDFHGGEALELQARIHRLQGPQEPGVVGEGQRRVQPADDMEFGDAQGQRLTGLGHHLFFGQLKPVVVALLAAEGAELAAQDAVVGVVDVPVEDVGSLAPIAALVGEVGQSRQRVEVPGLEQPQPVSGRQSLTGDHLVPNVLKPVGSVEQIHRCRKQQTLRDATGACRAKEDSQVLEIRSSSGHAHPLFDGFVGPVDRLHAKHGPVSVGLRVGVPCSIRPIAGCGGGWG